MEVIFEKSTLGLTVKIFISTGQHCNCYHYNALRVVSLSLSPSSETVNKPRGINGPMQSLRVFLAPRVFLSQPSKHTFSKNHLLGTFNCKMVAIKKTVSRQKKK